MIRSFIWEKKVSRYCTLKSIKKITLVQSLIPLKRKKKRKNISFLLKLYLELGNGMKWNGIWKSKSQKKKKKKIFLWNASHDLWNWWIQLKDSWRCGFQRDFWKEHNRNTTIMIMCGTWCLFFYKKTSFQLERAQRQITESSTLPLSTLWPNFNPNKHGQKPNGLAKWFLRPHHIHGFWI